MSCSFLMSIDPWQISCKTVSRLENCLASISRDISEAWHKSKSIKLLTHYSRYGRLCIPWNLKNRKDSSMEMSQTDRVVKKMLWVLILKLWRISKRLMMLIKSQTLRWLRCYKRTLRSKREKKRGSIESLHSNCRTKRESKLITNLKRLESKKQRIMIQEKKKKMSHVFKSGKRSKIKRLIRVQIISKKPYRS